MLRIHHDRVTSREVSLVVEGDLLGPWVEELRKTCDPFLRNGRKLSLDLSGVLFADREGVALLRYLGGRQAQLNCSAFLAELMRDQEPQERG